MGRLSTSWCRWWLSSRFRGARWILKKTGPITEWMKKTYKTPLKVRLSNKAYYEAQRAARGTEFLAEMAKWKRDWRAKGSTKKDRERRKYKRSRKSTLVRRAKLRARKAGLGATIKLTEIYWPSHCPVLGIELDYTSKDAARKPRAPNLPSLDRWDNSIGYVPGNVFVISMRANCLKGNATPEELLAVYNYAKTKPQLAGATS